MSFLSGVSHVDQCLGCRVFEGRSSVKSCRESGLQIMSVCIIGGTWSQAVLSLFDRGADKKKKSRREEGVIRSGNRELGG